MSDPETPDVLTCDDVREMAGSYVLGALDPGEEAAVRAHLASCADAHDEMAELGGVLSALGESVPVVEPPAGLKARIMSAAAAELATRETGTRAAPAAATSSDAAAGTAPAPAAAATAATTSTTTTATPTAAGATTAAVTAAAPIAFPSDAERAARDTRRGRTSTGAWVLRIAAVLAIVGLAGWNILLQGQLSAARTYERSVAAVLDVAAQPGSLTAVLTPDGGTGSGIAAVSATGDVTMALTDLAPTTGNAVYEAWVIGGDGVPVPLGSFDVGTSGTASFQTAGLPTTDGIVLALTLEPGPGAKTPTAPVITKGVATSAG